MKKWTTNKWFRRSLWIIGVLLLLEIVARYALGLGELPLYKEHHAYEYFYKPNQEVYRFGNRIFTNSMGMRSPEPDKKKQRVLLIGDSVINGGAHVDHSKLASTILDVFTNQQFDLQTLNISAGSWGPDNAFAFIQEHGDFNARLIILAFSSHDYNDNMHHRKVVGRHPSWPNKQPLLALTDGFSRYVWPKITAILGVKNDEYAYLKGFDDSKVNSGWKAFFDYCSDNKIHLLVYHHPEWLEVQRKSYTEQGLKLQEMCENAGVKYISGIEYPHSEEEYRDNIHTTDLGQLKIVSILKEHLKDMTIN